MLEALQLLATFCAAIFAGAALYINLAEHPSRLSLEPAAAVAQWASSYRRAARMQAPLAVVAFLAATGAWMLGGGVLWLVAGVLIGVVVPFTFLGVIPVNQKLLAPGPDHSSDEIRMLLEKWGRLHAVRTVLSLIATVLMLWGLSD